MLSYQAGSRVCASEKHARVERRLRRFSPRARAAVHAAADRHPRVADLAISFPSLLFALAVPRREVDVECAIAAAIDGRPLSDVAKTVGVPLWLRRLPVDGLTRPLPSLPDGHLFRRQIVNHLPRSPKLMSVWLDAVSFAARWSHESFAIWIARELTRDAKSVKIERLNLMSLWAWFSVNKGTAGQKIVEKPWRPALCFKTALDAAEKWRMRVALCVNLGEMPIADTWLEPGCVSGYEFVPLRSIDDIAAEAVAMKNCLNSYGYNLAHNRSRLWSVRRNGERVATLRVARQLSDPLLSIRELMAERNEKVPVEVWWAARTWLNQHNLPAIDTQDHAWGSAPLDAVAWKLLWRPYWLAKRGIPWWLPLVPSRRSLGGL